MKKTTAVLALATILAAGAEAPAAPAGVAEVTFVNASSTTMIFYIDDTCITTLAPGKSAHVWVETGRRRLKAVSRDQKSEAKWTVVLGPEGIEWTIED